MDKKENIIFHGIDQGNIERSLIIVLFLAFIPALNSCIEPYDPGIEEETDMIAIDASLIKGQDLQTVVISEVSPLIYPQYFTVKGCEVIVKDDLDNSFVYNENQDGTYSLAIPDEQLVLNRKYKLEITTPSGEKYESAFEKLYGGAPVDTIYYEIQEKFDKFEEKNLLGLQLYLDIKAPDTVSRYYRWNLAETYEYTSVAPVSFYFTDDVDVPIVYPADKNEVFRCWKTNDIQSLFLSNTVNLTLNEKKRIPLNYVTTASDKLEIKYSLFVRQYTLNEGAYYYWLENKNATQESGGLYTQQPGKPVSNIFNVNDSTEEILGYFWVSHSTDKRIFIPRISELPVIGDKCELVVYNPDDHKGTPRYIWIDSETGIWMTSTKFCMNCILKGGTVIRPDFWE